MRRALALAALSAAAGFPLSTPAATACDPNSFPGCEKPCAAVASRYGHVADSMHPAPPPWPHTGVAGCP